MTFFRDDLKKLIESGLVSDIFRMERSYALLKATGQHAAVFNSREAGNFGELFGAIQSALQTDCIMAVARIFDPPGRRYQNRGMRHVLFLIKTHKNELSAIEEPYQLGLALKAAGLEADLGALIDKGGSIFAEGVSDRFTALIDESGRAEAIDTLKTLRDKAIAHNENVESVEGPTWEAIADLMQIAKSLVGILGWAYLRIAYEANGDFILSGDAARASRALERLAARLQTTASAPAT